MLQEITDPEFKQLVRELCGQLWGIHRPLRSMPCSNPCSLMQSDIPTVRAGNYVVGEKTDGQRLFMVCGIVGGLEVRAFVDRAFRMFVVPGVIGEPYLRGSLFDGEWVQSDGGCEYVAFDVVAACGTDMRGYHHSKRMKVLGKAFQTVVIPNVGVRVKRWYPLDYARRLFEEAENCDGLILVSQTGPLVNGRQTDHFKWKLAHHHTVDFTVFPDRRMEVGRGEDAFSALGIVFAGDLPDNLPAVVECECRQGSEGWTAIPVRIRQDKDRPNSTEVARRTLQNIVENLGIEDFA